MARLTRALVIGSTLVAVATGLWPLQAQPSLLAMLGGLFAAVLLAARVFPATATAVVLGGAYVSYGVARLALGAETAGMPFFLAAFAGLALGTSSWTTWTARRPWRVPLAWWATSVALTWPYVAARELHFALPSSPVAGPILTAALLQLCLALWMDRWLRERDHSTFFRDDDLPLRDWHLPLVWSALVTAAAAIYQARVDITWLSGEPWTRLGRAVGMMGDANPMGVATALWAPITVAAFATSLVSSLFGIVLAVPLWLAAWVSGARTSLILFGAGAAALLLLVTAALGWSRRRVVTAAVIAAAGLLAVAVVAAPRVDPATPIGRLLSALPGSPADAAYELLWRRDGYGVAAAAAIAEHPLFGVGIGRFTGLSPAYAQRAGERAIPPDNAQNLWRHTFAEQGLLGLVPILWLTGLAVVSVFSGRADGVDLVLRVMLAGFGAGLMVGYPVQDPAIAVTLASVVCAVGRQPRTRR